MKKVKLAALLIALTATGFQSLEAATFSLACSEKDLSLLADLTPNCQNPISPTLLAQHSGMTLSLTQVCLRMLAGQNDVVRLSDGTYCRQTG